MDYGNQMEIPWGISESAYSALDANQTYQYRAFGVPQLALKPGLEDEGLVDVAIFDHACDCRSSPAPRSRTSSALKSWAGRAHGFL